MKRTSLPSPRMNPPQLLPYVLRMSVYVQSLKDAKMRAHAFDTMIDVAEEMFNLPIRKKAGTKQ